MGLSHFTRTTAITSCLTVLRIGGRFTVPMPQIRTSRHRQCSHPTLLLLYRHRLLLAPRPSLAMVASRARVTDRVPASKYSTTAAAGYPSAVARRWRHSDIREVT